MKRAAAALVSSLFVASLVLFFLQTNHGQNRERFVISARAGGINAVTGRAAIRAHGSSDWQLLTIKEDLETGDAVRTSPDGRVEMLLNPGSYLRVAENSEFELTDNSLENLEVRLIRGTAIVEVTGADDAELLINITTPHTRMAIVRRGLYRVNVLPGDVTELIVRKGRVMLDGSRTKVKGGNKVVFNGDTFSVAKLEKPDKKNKDLFDSWSQNRGETLAKANGKISGRTLNGFLASVWNDRSMFASWRGVGGFWMYNQATRCYTFVPFSYGWGSPYGYDYSRSFYAGVGCCGSYGYGRYGGVVVSPTTGSSTGNGTIGPATSGGNPLPRAARVPVPTNGTTVRRTMPEASTKVRRVE